MSAHTFDTLEDMTASELEAIKKQAFADYSAEVERRWALIAAILFFQRETDKMREAA